LFVFGRDFEDLFTSRSRLHEMNVHQTCLANTDMLTGLANRRRFYSVLDRSAEEGAPCTVLLIDLDGFKQINDLHGHAVGDEVLREVAKRIAHQTAGSLCTARTGGDEFAVIVAGLLSDVNAGSYGGRIIEALGDPVVLETVTLLVGASIGVFNRGADPRELANRHVEQADYALFEAKQNGRNRVSVFRPEHEALIKRSSHVEQVVRNANLGDELKVVFQPIVDARTGNLNGFEALARWHSSTLGQVTPGEFIPIAERSDMIHAITSTVMKKALAQAREWPVQIQLKVNLSARDLCSRSSMNVLVTQLAESEITPSRLTFEVTETALGGSFEAIQSAVAMIKDAKIGLAVDDFGTGYSSLSYIHNLKPDLIKIDQSFVSRLGKDDGAEAIIETIIALCRGVGARCLAEGVETDQQMRILRSMGCDELQGFGIGRPMDAGDPALLGESFQYESETMKGGPFHI
jgi:diguanylate cyclase (GGDEF)-like protein